MSVNYKEIGKGVVLKTHYQTACYSKVFSYALEPGTDELILYDRHNCMNDENIIKEWIKDINDVGFPIEYLGKDATPYDVPKGYYVYRILLAEYVYKHHLLSTLTLARYMFESGFQNIVKNYFKAKKEIPKIPTIDAIILAHNYYGGGGNGHSLHYHAKNTVISKEQLFENFKNSKTLVHEQGRKSQMNTSWTSKDSIVKTPGDTLAQMYAKMKPNAKKKVFIVGGGADYVNWLTDFAISRTMVGADLVVFTGGEDVDPSLYNAATHPTTGSNLARDKKEKLAYEKAKLLKLPMLGVCRGSQFLCVMNGGTLVQHQQNPKAIHEIETDKYGKFMITSTHHQAAHPFNLHNWDYRIIGWTNGVSKFHYDGDGEELNPPKECEIVYYKNTRCLGIQGHPEFTRFQQDHPESLAIIKTIFNDFLNNKL